ncbi:MAG: peptidyl-prolyl cis-trans isomerase, cyclophilin-type [Candidatus Uhrbacteria bacterium GW2011_GWE2_40_58]|nr:MAG: peptidyl-prolyl cis-trans isomerase, cyclophilin-type [Candidatus Uhrbacteria bacterium GW2011_GWF2_40_263]KKR68250.1 MAG: peptidyl-prolyl cis-trans isomerase, cyclophilin-type [Candidatus Uhrbacteria bacterium GW2011_GWE2_40_58]
MLLPSVLIVLSIDNMKNVFPLVAVALLLFLGTGCSAPKLVEGETTSLETININEVPMDTLAFPGTLLQEEIAGKQIRIQTGKGDIVFELFANTAPLAVSNMIYLTQQGYFDQLTFHRRVEGFVIQGGDPNGDGTGGPGYTFADELSDQYSYQKGIVAMANRGPDTNGSQFFIMLEDYALPKAYTIFGRVIEGQEVVDAIAIGDVMTSVTVEDQATVLEKE